jgi:hypothetical protein
VVFLGSEFWSKEVSFLIVLGGGGDLFLLSTILGLLFSFGREGVGVVVGSAHTCWERYFCESESGNCLVRCLLLGAC